MSQTLKPADNFPVSERSVLAQEAVSVFISKVDKLPIVDPNLIVLAAIEAAAWIAAEESAANAKLSPGDHTTAAGRVFEYANVFKKRALQDLQYNYDNW